LTRAVDFFNDNLNRLGGVALAADDPEKYNLYEGLRNLADGMWRQAEECFEENVRLSGGVLVNPEKFNLYGGLAELARELERRSRRP